jgi:death-on-curing protein
MIVWLEKDLVLAIHDRQLAEHGGASGVRDATLLESALARPQQLHAYGDPPPDLADLAASLAFRLARNHPFVEGNKRTAHVSYRVFLALNGADVEASAENMFIALLALAEGRLREEDFAVWLRDRIRSAAHNEVHGPRKRYAPKRKRKRKKVTKKTIGTKKPSHAGR